MPTKGLHAGHDQKGATLDLMEAAAKIFPKDPAAQMRLYTTLFFVARGFLQTWHLCWPCAKVKFGLRERDAKKLRGITMMIGACPECLAVGVGLVPNSDLSKVKQGKPISD